MAQDDIISTLGCKRNPYTQEGMSAATNWQGGWVLSSDEESIQYYNTNYVVQYTIEKGYIGYPYTENEYLNLLHDNFWVGGYVVYPDLSLQYINNFNVAGERVNIGKMENPYYYVEFQNMYAENYWIGGWVEYESGGKAYINAQGEEDEDPEASGSGGGSGSGSGSGDGGGSCNITTGFDYAGIIAQGTHYRLYVSWTSGTACTGGTSSITADVIGYYHNGILVDCSGSASCYWSGDYEATITYLGESILFHVGEFYYGT